jgi:hypothetical protein
VICDRAIYGTIAIIGVQVKRDMASGVMNIFRKGVGSEVKACLTLRRRKWVG